MYCCGLHHTCVVFIVHYKYDSFFVFFFFKQKTAYEIYQCDWSSDVCSSDLAFKEKNYFSIIVNSNPETVSADYDTSDRLYFEPDRKSVV